MTDKPKKGPRLRTETRAYTVTDAELTEWLTGAAEPRFYISEVWIQPSGEIEFTVTTQKQSEVPVVRRAGSANDFRTVDETTLPHDEHGLTPNDEGYEGPAVIDDGVPVGKADAMPMIASRSEVQGKKRLMTAREIKLAEQKAARRAQAGPTITHREDDDPVPSAIPGR